MSVAIEGVNTLIEGRGTVNLKFGSMTIILTYVIYSPKLRRNLISGPQLDKKGISFCNCRGRGEVEIAEDGKVLFSAYLKNGVYHLYPKVLGPRKRITFEASALMDKKLEFWHKRLAHVSPSVISRTVKENSARGLPNFKNFELKCEPCQLNKQRRVSFKRQEGIRSRRPLELLYGDVWEPCNKIESIPFQKPHSGAVLEPVYLKFEPFEPFPDEDSRHERIIKDASDKSSVATPESSEDETDEDSPDTHKPSTKTVNWFLDQMVAIRMSTITRKDVLKD
ncbi:retrovirus-related Pol polyprotein from transposon TNT 1-94 [Trichonephila clavata]|nr:retrovirus-related Pol polyprotein from transposon TNT 1-94 [Trichonephila clavata]